MFTRALWCAAVAAGCLLSGAARGQVLIDNMAEKTRGLTTLGPKEEAADFVYAAQSFGTQEFYTLVSVEILAGFVVGAPDIVAQLRAGPDPTGPSVAVFSVAPMRDDAAEAVTLAPDQGVLLQPGETYWLVIGSVGAGTFQWGYAQGNIFEGPGYFGNYEYSSDDVVWTNFGGDNPYQMRVNIGGVKCSADFNHDGVVNSGDFFDFLTAFFTEDPSADFNLDAQVNSQDFFDFLSAFFGGC